MNMLKSFRDARLRGVPIVSISTPDQPATIEALRAAENGDKDKPHPPVIAWDIVTGMRPVNTAAIAPLLAMAGYNPDTFNTDEDRDYKALVEAEANRLGRKLTANEVNKIKNDREVEFQNKLRSMTVDPDTMLLKARQLPGADEKTGTLGSVLIVCNAHAILANDFPIKVAVRQAVVNLRDAYKASNRMLVLLGPDISLAAVELGNDVIPLTEEYPNDERLKEIVLDQFAAAGIAKPDADTLELCVDALRGIAVFPAEQITAMSLKKAGIDIDLLRERKRTEIEKTRGLTVDRERITLEAVGGKKQIIKLLDRYFHGKRRPRFVLRIDEIDKGLAGAGAAGASDGTGTSQDQHGVLLKEMEDNGYSGLLLVSPPGCGKTLLSKALGGTYNVMSASLDLGALLEKWVGSSQEHIRNVFKLLRAIAGYGGVLVIGTCNKLENLSPEMRRRFKLGIWYDDLPTEREKREEIWPIQLKAYGLPLNSTRPNDFGWTGSDIRNCCELAYSTDCSLSEAAEFLVPVSKSDPGSIDRLRAMAKGSFLSTAYPGPYKGPEVEEGTAPVKPRVTESRPAGRRVRMEDSD